MKKGLKGLCALFVAVSLMTGLFTACGNKIEYSPSSGSDINGGQSSDINAGGNYTDVTEPTLGGSSNGDSMNNGSSSGGYSGGGNSGSSGNSGGSSGSYNTTASTAPTTTTTTASTTTTTKYVYDLKKVLNSAPLNPMKTNDPELDAKVDKIFAELGISGMSTYDQVRAIFNYLVQSNIYGYMVPGPDLTYVSPYDMEVVSKATEILKRHMGTCIDFACAFMVMTRRIGLNCYMVKGNVSNGVQTSYHGWNVIRIGDRDYVFDAEADFRNSGSGKGPTKFTNFGIYNPDKFKVELTNLAEFSFKNFNKY